MSPQDAEQVMLNFRNLILPHRLQQGVNDSEAWWQEMGTYVTQSILQDLEGLDRAGIIHYTYIERYRAMLEPIDTALQTLAEQAYLKERSVDELRSEASKQHAKLMHVADEIMRYTPDIYPMFGTTISESLMDYHYVTTGGRQISLRLNQFIKMIEAGD
jgi:hypothetical protein